MSKKIYQLMISKTFLTGHPKAGQPTDFKRLIENGIKKHTVRGNIEYWEKVAAAVNAGTHVLSVKQWDGRPYHSNQTELFRLEKITLQKIEIKDKKIFIEGTQPNSDILTALARNDGLSFLDFMSWFNYPKNFEGVIIQFTDFKY